MNNRNGFTLVELMVVIVIVGVLAAVAIPRLIAAADRARASEGPSILGAIARMQEAYYVKSTAYRAANTNAADWTALGFDGRPVSRFFTFTSETNSDNSNFVATAEVNGTTLGVNTGTVWIAATGDDRAISRGAQGNIQSLVPSWSPAEANVPNINN